MYILRNLKMGWVYVSLFLIFFIFTGVEQSVLADCCASCEDDENFNNSPEVQEHQKNRKILQEFHKKISFFELNELRNNNPDWLTPAFFKNMNVKDKNNSDLEKDADFMFEKVKPFFEAVKSKSRDEYVDYVRKYMCVDDNVNVPKMKTVNSEEFAELENNPEYVVVYCGKRDKNLCEKLRSGVPLLDNFGSKTGTMLCTSQFTCPYYSRACGFAGGFGDTGEYGEVVRFAIKKSAKLIHQNYLEAIFKRMVEKNPDYFKNYLNIIETRGEHYFTLQPNFDHFSQWVKNKTGFDFFANCEALSFERRLFEFVKHFSELVGATVRYNGKNGLVDCEPLEESKISVEQKQARTELFEFLKVHPMTGIGSIGKCLEHQFDQEYFDRLNALDNWMFDPVLWLSGNQGLLTKLLGFDIHVRISKDYDSNKEEDLAQKHDDFVQMPEGVCDIVNFDNVTVCSDEFKLEQKLELDSVYDAEKFLPNLVSAKDVDSRLQLYSGDIDQDAEVMFEKVKAFLERAEKDGISEKEFDDYSRNCIKHNSSSDSNSIFVAGPDWFDEHKDDPAWLILYRGISHKPFAESARRGEVYIGGQVKGGTFTNNLAQEGNGIYLTSILDWARFFAKIPDILHSNESQKFGEIVKFALSRDAKIVSAQYLYTVFEKMLEKHSDYSYFKKYAELKKIYGLRYRNWSASSKLTFDFVKEKTGFDFFADVDKKSFAEREKLYDAAFDSLFKCDEDVSEKNLKELADIYEANRDCCTGQNEYLIDKIYYLSHNLGLLAKFINCDVVYLYIPGIKLCADKPFNVYDNPEVNDFNVVNYGKLVVCSEPEIDDARIRWGEKIYL